MNNIRDQLIIKIRNIKVDNFTEIAKEVYNYQIERNPIFNKYLKNLGSKNNDFQFLPISAFKNEVVKSGEWQSSEYFESSGTTGSINSKHFYKDKNWYLENCRKGFEIAFGEIKNYCFLALLPHYLERSNSSLIAMVDYFIKESQFNHSGFFLTEFGKLKETLEHNKINKIPTVLFGVSFALKEFSENHKIEFPDLIIIETGGMKGRQEEITREELHSIISKGFRVKNVHSEYGMTELFSQAYSKEHGIFYPSPSMKVSIKEITDPTTNEINNKTGIINIIDLANIDTCSFIATEDLGRLHNDGSFEVLGRLDNSDMRGCNLMV